VITCEEELGSGTLVATNIFAKEDGVWRIVHHQAGPQVMQRPHPAARPPTSLH
jgi:SnoaL-like domain